MNEVEQLPSPPINVQLTVAVAKGRELVFTTSLLLAHPIDFINAQLDKLNCAADRQ